MSKVVQEKKERLAIAGRNQVPDYVPITSQIETFAYGYGGVTIDDVKKNPFKGVNAFRKSINDFYFDGYFEGFFVHPFNFFDALGADSYFASADGHTAQHKEIAPMEADEFQQLIDNPVDFFLNEINTRKFPNLNGDVAGQEKTILKALLGLLNYGAGMMGQGVALPLLTDTPSFFGGFIEMPFDNIFDFLRGFRNTSYDLRRQPEALAEAADAIFEQYTIYCERVYSLLNVIEQPKLLANNFVSAFVKDQDPKCVDFPWFFNPTHAPSFMNDKQYEKLYWPSYKKTIELITSWGGHVCTLLEGKWGEGKLELFKDLEPGTVTLYCDEDDVCDVKKQLGNYQSIMGGMPLSMLKTASKKECIMHAMHVLDECAPGGGFIFTTDKSLLSVHDTNYDNLKAVNEFVHAYGKY